MGKSLSLELQDLREPEPPSGVATQSVLTAKGPQGIQDALKFQLKTQYTIISLFSQDHWNSKFTPTRQLKNVLLKITNSTSSLSFSTVPGDPHAGCCHFPVYPCSLEAYIRLHKSRFRMSRPCASSAAPRFTSQQLAVSLRLLRPGLVASGSHTLGQWGSQTTR
ncbi:hypothetical protein CB1_001681003 [Camelus ferus]|nr:hypothetical protein CB1_001681003 [Camelus ferus]